MFVQSRLSHRPTHTASLPLMTRIGTSSFLLPAGELRNKPEVASVGWTDDEMENCRQFMHHYMNRTVLGQVLKFQQKDKLEDRIERVTRALSSGSIAADKVLSEWTGSEMKMSAVRRIAPSPGTSPPGDLTSDALLRGPLKTGFVGPYACGDDECFLRVSSVENWEYDSANKKYSRSPVPYFIHFRIVGEFLHVTWRNRQVREHYEVADGEGQDRYPKITFQYWDEVGPAIEEFTTWRGLDLVDVDLEATMLDKVWDLFTEDAAYKHRPTRIRAESDNLFLSAHAGNTGSAADISLSGVEVLADKLASVALADYPGSADENVQRKMSRALLRTIIRDWGPRSYEVEIQSVNGDAKDKNRFKAHVYFGRLNAGIDRLQHFVNYSKWGGSNRTFDFITKYIV